MNVYEIGKNRPKCDIKTPAIVGALRVAVSQCAYSACAYSACAYSACGLGVSPSRAPGEPGAVLRVSSSRGATARIPRAVLGSPQVEQLANPERSCGSPQVEQVASTDEPVRVLGSPQVEEPLRSWGLPK